VTSFSNVLEGFTAQLYQDPEKLISSKVHRHVPSYEVDYGTFNISQFTTTQSQFAPTQLTSKLYVANLVTLPSILGISKPPSLKAAEGLFQTGYLSITGVPTVGPCLGPYEGLGGGAVSYKRGTPVLHCLP